MLSTGNKAEITVARDIFFVDGGATLSETLESFRHYTVATTVNRHKKCVKPHNPFKE